MTDDEAIAGLARRINASGDIKGVLYLTGGGSEVLPMLLGRGGGSNTLLAARIPYSPEDFRAVVGHDPGPFVAGWTAGLLAKVAFRHAQSIRGDLPPESVFGLGATSKLSRGPGEREARSHEVHAALHDVGRSIRWSLTLPAGLDRPAEEHINARLLLNLVAEAKGMDDGLPLGDDLRPSRRAITARDCRHPRLPGLFAGRIDALAFDFPGDGSVRPADFDADPPRLLLPGSFQPLHDGHLVMAETASRMLGTPCAFETSIVHPVKPSLDYFSIHSRSKDFRSLRGRPAVRLFLTNAPTYVEKARLFPGCTFAVGHDTAERIVDPRFYGGVAGRDAMLDELESLGARFLVFGRVDAEGRFRDFTPEEFDAPVARFASRAVSTVPADLFRVDLSSTEIRKRLGEEMD